MTINQPGGIKAMSEQKSESGLTGTLRLVLSIAVIVTAGLAVLFVFDIIPEEIFGEGVQKLGLLTVIVVLAGAAVALISRVGK